MISGDFFMSLMAAMGSPQLATGPQKCYGGKRRGRREEASGRSCEQLCSSLIAVSPGKQIPSSVLRAHWSPLRSACESAVPSGELRAERTGQLASPDQLSDDNQVASDCPIQRSKLLTHSVLPELKTCDSFLRNLMLTSIKTSFSNFIDSS